MPYQYDVNERCIIVRLTPELAALPISCGDTEGDRDLEDFFHKEAIPFAEERLGQTYCVIDNEGDVARIVAFSTQKYSPVLNCKINLLYRIFPLRTHPQDS